MPTKTKEEWEEQLRAWKGLNPILYREAYNALTKLRLADEEKSVAKSEKEVKAELKDRPKLRKVVKSKRKK